MLGWSSCGQALVGRVQSDIESRVGVKDKRESLRGTKVPTLGRVVGPKGGE